MKLKNVGDKLKVKNVSKFLSLVLRHKPEVVGVKLDPNGWVDVDKLLDGCAKVGRNIDMALLDRTVVENDKMRFTFNADKTKIRANQGHSQPVDVELEELEPPLTLYHGTLERNWRLIREQGLLKMERLYVHLSVDEETARKVAERRVGAPMLLKVDSGKMYRDEYKFYRSLNGVWLTDHVPPKYISVLNFD